MMPLKQISFEVLADPIPLARSRFANGRAYLPERSRSYRKILQDAAKIVMSNFEPLTGALYCRLVFYRKFEPTVRNYGDSDNLLKAVLDAFNGLIFGDDSQLIDISVVKCTDKAEPRVVAEFGTVDCKNLPPIEPSENPNASVWRTSLKRIL